MNKIYYGSIKKAERSTMMSTELSTVLGLSFRAVKALNKNGIVTIDELKARNIKDLRWSCNGIGPNIHREIKQKLSNYITPQ